MEQPSQQLELKRVHISKALAWVLRHSPKKTKNGDLDLEFFKGGFVLLHDIRVLPQFKQWTEKEIIDAVEHSISNIDHVTRRFEHVDVEGRTFIRAKYGHTFFVDAYPPLTAAGTHTVVKTTDIKTNGTAPKRLYKMCAAAVAKHIKHYSSLHDAVIDPYILWDIFVAIKKQNKLTNMALRLFLNPVTEHLDLSDLFISDTMLQKIAKECPSLTALNLKGNAAVVTNHSLQFVLRRQTSLVSLGVANCRYLNDTIAPLIALSCPKLTTLDLSGCALITDPALLTISSKCTRLSHLSISHCQSITEEGVAFLHRSPLLSLDLSWNKQLKASVLVPLLSKLSCATSLRDLNLCAIETLTESLLTELLRATQSLRNLNIRGIESFSVGECQRLESAFPTLHISIGKALDPALIASTEVSATSNRPSAKKK